MKKSVFVLSLLVAMLGLTACGGSVISQNADTPEKAAVVNLEKAYQRVIRYNCENKVTSDKIEVVVSPVKYMAIHPKYEGWTQENITSSSFTNVTTKTGAGMIVDRVNFSVEYETSTYLYMRVNRGINQIDYQFDFNNGQTEKGSRYINVSYTETHKDGFSEIKPSTEECKKKN